MPIPQTGDTRPMPGGEPVSKLRFVSSLPHPTRQVIGRRDDIRLVLRALADQRLVTLVGPGGVGKTALAIEVTEEAEPEFGRVVSASVVNAEDLGEVACLVSTAVMGQPIEDISVIASALAATPTLLLIDNCEQAIDAVAEITEGLLTNSPETRVLATSRRPLNLANEVTVTVKPLPFPTDLATAPVTDFAAVQLFLERVRQADPTFELTDSNAGVIADICGRADGIPLAIELAAALVRTRSLTDILAAMVDGSDSLSGRRRDLHVHQRSVAASFEWSRQFLSLGERRLLDRLSVFVGGFTAEAARIIGEADDDGALTQLVDHSLVLFDQATGRYRLLEVLRSDAESRLEPDEWHRLVDRHARWCQHLAVQIREGMFKPDPARLFPDFDHEIPNLGSALRRCWQRGDINGFREILAPMANWWVHHARPEGVEHWPELLLDSEITHEQSMNIRLALAYHFSHRGQYEESIIHARKAHELAATVGDHDTAAAAVMSEANAKAATGNVDSGIALLNDALVLSQRSETPFVGLWARVNLARLDPEGAARHLTGALQIAQQGFTIAEALVLMELSRIASADGRTNEAIRISDESIAIMRETDYSEGLATALTTRAHIAASVNDFSGARAGFDEALLIGSRITHRAVVAGARDGLAGLPDSSAPITTMPTDQPLTDRELAVAHLLRGDLTQREIADELYVAPSTVKTHVKSIYRKLGVAKRSHAITRAAELGLFNR